jgi:hypothetical protein
MSSKIDGFLTELRNLPSFIEASANDPKWSEHLAAIASLSTGVGEVAGVAAIGGAAASAVGDANGIGGLY